LNKNWIWIGLAALVAIPAIVVNYTLYKTLVVEGNKGIGTSPILASIIFGVAIVGAAFLLSWACEVAQLDIPQALALSVLALIAVLPEYSVDFALTFEAGQNPEYQEFAVANMIGANRMIVGFAWPLVIFLFWLKFRKAHITLGHGQRVEIGFLAAAGFYSLIIPIKGSIDFIDFFVLVGLFAIYTFRITKAEVHEPELIGPAEMIARYSKTVRRLLVVAMLLWAGVTIFILAHHFAEALIDTGQQIGIDEVFMVQWFAPLASEAPEIVVVILFTLRGFASEGLGALVASKVNQWTLLVGTLPFVFSLGSGALRSLPLTQRCNPDLPTGAVCTAADLVYSPELVGSMLVTSAQTILAVMIIMNLRAGLFGAGILFFLLVAQFFFPNDEKLHTANFIFFRADAHYVFAGLYFAIALFLIVRDREHFMPTIRSMLSPAYVRQEARKFGEVEETGVHGEIHHPKSPAETEAEVVKSKK
jgi:cation:H+ antiporter